jgi:hypothetical protein
MALTPGSVVQISGAPSAGEQVVTALSVTAAQIEEAVRLSLTPSHLGAQLPESASPIVTPYPTANTPVVLGGVDQLALTDGQDFTFDVGNNRFFYSKSGAVDVPFNVMAVLSFSQSAANAELFLRATKNGVALEGIYFQRTISTSNVVGVGTLAGHFTLSENDYIEITVESDKTGNVNSWSFATDIKEEGQ